MNKRTPELYTTDELKIVEKHIELHFGKITNVFHEILSPDIHVDISIIEPTEARPYWTLVTIGMGAHRMNTPTGAEHLTRAEVLLTLPPDWKLQDTTDERWYWPIRWLKILARLPIEHETWLGWGHTVPSGEPLAENTQLSSVLLVNPPIGEKNSDFCVLPNNNEIQFYQVIPLYDEEMNFKISHGAEKLLDLLLKSDDFSHIIHIDRKNTCLSQFITH